MHRPINIGQANTRIAIQYQATSTTLGFPDPAANWSDRYSNIQALRVVRGGDESDNKGTREYQQRAEFTIQYAPNITRNDRVVELGSKIYIIEDIQELGTRSGLKLICKTF